MLVKYIGNNNKIHMEGRKFFESRDDGCFSAREISTILGMDVNLVLSEIEKLQETDWVVRDGVDWTPPVTPDTRWIAVSHPSLTLGQTYEVLGIKYGSYRIVDDYCDPVLFDASGFELVDCTEPEFWECEEDEDGDRYSGPPQWNKPSFMEDYHDGVEEARRQFHQDLKDLYPYTWRQAEKQKRDNIKELIHFLKEIKEGFMLPYDDDGAAAFVGLGQAIDGLFDHQIMLLEKSDFSQIRNLRILATQCVLLREMQLSKDWDRIFQLISSVRDR